MILLLLAALHLPPSLAGLQFGMSRAEAERAAGKKAACGRYGQFQAGDFCIVLGFQRDVLDDIALDFESIDDAHAKLTNAWGEPIRQRDRELWLGESVQAWLFPYMGRARLELRAYRPFAKLLGKKLTLDGKKLLSLTRPEIRAAFGRRAYCDDTELCSVYLPPAEYDQSSLSLMIEFENDRVSNVIFMVAAQDPRQLLKIAERTWGKAIVEYSGLVKDVIRFAGEKQAHAEAMEHTVIFCIGKCP